MSNLGKKRVVLGRIFRENLNSFSSDFQLAFCSLDSFLVSRRHKDSEKIEREREKKRDRKNDETREINKHTDNYAEREQKIERIF